MFSLSMESKSMERQLKKLAKQSPEAFKHALKISGIQFLTWANNGSSKESRKPPIATGFLRGSSSAFVGSKLVTVMPGYDNSAAATSGAGSEPLNVTWVWNAEYATKMHEGEYTLGEKSVQDGDAGSKWLERHLDADRENFMKVTAAEFGKKLGTL